MSALGLNWGQRYWSRQRVKNAALACARHASMIHYTQGSRRWDYINHRCHPATDGSYPAYADCSSIVTGYYWDATRRYGLGDFVNGAHWQYGYTGTMIQHGVDVTVRRSRLLTGDAIFYGGWSVPTHVAVYVGDGLVVSHGSERGPVVSPWAYRTPSRVKRYIR